MLNYCFGSESRAKSKDTKCYRLYYICKKNICKNILYLQCLQSGFLNAGETSVILKKKGGLVKGLQFSAEGIGVNMFVLAHR